MNTVPHLFFRADASVAMGTGHVMRCLALAQAWQDAGGTATFAMADSTPAIEARLKTEAINIVPLQVSPGSPEDAAQTSSLARQTSATWVVVDGYQFKSEYQLTLRNSGLKVLFVDDNGESSPYAADLVLNQNAHATQEMYRNRAEHTRLLLGTRYVLLRREFAQWRDWKRNFPQVARHVLVTMGGSDPDNVTERVVEAVLSTPELTATVVVGGSNPHWSDLQTRAAHSNGILELKENASDMPRLMAEADLAVAGAGTTTWETCFLGLPALLSILADNQRHIAETLRARGVIIFLGEGKEVTPSAIAAHLAAVAGSPDLRKSMSERGRELVDGKGAERIVQALQLNELGLRRATRLDCKLLWELANDPTVRQSSFSPEPIAWEHHLAWFQDRMRSNSHMFVAETRGKVVGQVRIDLRGDGEGEIDVIVAPEFRNRGIGARMIDVAMKELFVSSSISRVHAYILTQNKTSQRAFENAGFRNLGDDHIRGHHVIHYIQEKPATPE